MNFYISLSSSWWGGGSNTFAYNFSRWARRHAIRTVRKIADAQAALVIAGNASEEELQIAKRSGAFLIHRLDEHVEPEEDDYRRKKHIHIKRLNKLCDVTVFQSEFVKGNMQPYLRAACHTVILNGGDPESFRPGARPGGWIGHVTWGTGGKKRLDLLEAAIASHPSERFLLVGNHRESGIPWKKYKNVRLVGRIPRLFLPYLYRRMKALYFPSENDPCPNTAIEAVLSGVPVAYNAQGGTREIVRDCGLPIDQFDDMLQRLPEIRDRCRQRRDLDFDRTARAYWRLLPNPGDLPA